MTDWRYWITYTGRIQTESDNEDVAQLAAADAHAERLHDQAKVYLPEVEVEQVEGKNE